MNTCNHLIVTIDYHSQTRQPDLTAKGDLPKKNLLTKEIQTQTKRRYSLRFKKKDRCTKNFRAMDKFITITERTRIKN